MNNAGNGTVYPLHAAYRENSGALAPYYYQTDSSSGSVKRVAEAQKKPLFRSIATDCFSFSALSEKDRDYFISTGADLLQKTIAANTKLGMGLL